MGDEQTNARSASDARPKRRRLPGVNLRPGSVKQARLESGLSLAQLGKGHVTAPAIYLVETGRTRPSMPTLEHIARQRDRVWLTRPRDICAHIESLPRGTVQGSEDR